MLDMGKRTLATLLKCRTDMLTCSAGMLACSIYMLTSKPHPAGEGAVGDGDAEGDLHRQAKMERLECVKLIYLKARTRFWS